MFLKVPVQQAILRHTFLGIPIEEKRSRSCFKPAYNNNCIRGLSRAVHTYCVTTILVEFVNWHRRLLLILCVMKVKSIGRRAADYRSPCDATRKFVGHLRVATLTVAPHLGLSQQHARSFLDTGAHPAHFSIDMLLLEPRSWRVPKTNEKNPDKGVKDKWGNEKK